jgi:hypothetical protein
VPYVDPMARGRPSLIIVGIPVGDGGITVTSTAVPTRTQTRR